MESRVDYMVIVFLVWMHVIMIALIQLCCRRWDMIVVGNAIFRTFWKYEEFYLG